MFPSPTLRLPQAKLPLLFQPSLSHHVLEIIVLVLVQILSKVQFTNADSTPHLKPSLPDFADWNIANTSEFAAFLQQQHTETYPELISKRKKLISLLKILRLLQRISLKSWLAKAVQISM